MHSARRILIALAILLFPLTGYAATFAGQQSITLSQPVPDNAYIGGVNVTVSTDLPADLTAGGGTISVYAPVAGDVLAAGGTVVIDKAVGGDVRIAALKAKVAGDVAGDVAAAAGSLTVTGKARDIYAIGGTITVSGGASGPVTIYGTDVTLGGDFTGDVEIIASNHFTIADGTHIHGALRYNAPEQVTIPAGAVVDGGTTYTGSYAYVPTKEEARKFALAGTGVFIVVRSVAVMVIAGLLVGLFPGLAGRVTDMALRSGPRRSILLALLGFALFIASPILILLLLLSFVGAGVGFFIGGLYLMLIFLAYVYSAIIAGAALRYGILSRFSARHEISWRDAVLGVIVLAIISFIPYVGLIVNILLAVTAAGVLSTLAYRHAFRGEESISSE